MTATKGSRLNEYEADGKRSVVLPIDKRSYRDCLVDLEQNYEGETRINISSMVLRGK